MTPTMAEKIWAAAMESLASCAAVRGIMIANGRAAPIAPETIRGSGATTGVFGVAAPRLLPSAVLDPELLNFWFLAVLTFWGVWGAAPPTARKKE